MVLVVAFFFSPLVVGVGLAEEEDNFDFNEKFSALKKEFSEQLKEENKLNQRILESLKKIQYEK